MIDDVAEGGLAHGIEAGKAIEIERETIGHNAAMEPNKEPLLLRGIDGGDRAKTPGALWDEEVLVIVGPDVGGDHGVDGPGKGAIDAVSEDGFENGAFKDAIELAGVVRPFVLWLLCNGHRRGLGRS